jgi:hypothetical protein
VVATSPGWPRDTSLATPGTATSGNHETFATAWSAVGDQIATAIRRFSDAVAGLGTIFVWADPIPERAFDRGNYWAFGQMLLLRYSPEPLPRAPAQAPWRWRWWRHPRAPRARSRRPVRARQRARAALIALWAVGSSP